VSRMTAGGTEEDLTILHLSYACFQVIESKVGRSLLQASKIHGVDGKCRGVVRL